MNKADWKLLEKIQAGSMSDDEAFLLEREEDAYALAQAGYILIIGPGKQGSPHEGKCCAIILKEGTDALEEYKEKQKEKKRAHTVQTLGIVIGIPAAVLALFTFFTTFGPAILKTLGELL